MKETNDVLPADMTEARIGVALAEPSVAGVREVLSTSGTTRSRAIKWLPKANGDQDTW